MLNRRQIMDYEIRSSWWVPLCSWKWLQRLAGAWFANKVARKAERYERNMLEAERVRQRNST